MRSPRRRWPVVLLSTLVLMPLAAVVGGGAVAAAPAVVRLAGADRFETAAAVSRATVPAEAPVAYIVNGGGFADALAAGPVAAVRGGPILLVTRDGIPEPTATELRRLAPASIVVVGGTAVVSAAVEAQLRTFTTGAVSRIAGGDRYDTAARLAGSAFGAGVPVAFIATGEDFPDGLAGGAAGGSVGGPVLLVHRDDVPGATSDALGALQPKAIEVLGGATAISRAVEDELGSSSPSVHRAAGGDRFATSAAVSATSFTAPRATAYLATGAGFADALAGGPAAGSGDAPILLASGNCVSPEVKAELDRLAPQTLVVLGGTAAVGDGAAALDVCQAPSRAVKLTRVASLSQPLALAVRAGDPALYVAEKGGRVRAIRSGAVDPTPVLDISDAVSTGNEQGLLGLAFAPDGSFLYIDYTDTAGDTHVVEYPVGATGVDVAKRRELLFVDQPFANHNGGELVFGPDGRLFIGLGDGGSGNDPQDTAQNLGTALGKILRIDPRPTADGKPYGIPPDNPMVGVDGARPEIWSLGLRNPWRFSFDRSTGDLWIGDVGQDRFEEVDLSLAGAGAGGGKAANYGWPSLEGNHPVSGKPGPPPGAVPPLLEYPTASPNCAVTGGYVYRGARIPGLIGLYVYGDFCGGELRAVRQDGGALAEQLELKVNVANLSSFGQDAAGELYALSLGGGVFRIDPA